MAQDKLNQTNIDKSDLGNYPDGQIRDDDGTNNGTPVSRETMSDIFEFFAKLMRLGGFIFNDQYDNEGNGFQYISAMMALANKNNFLYSVGPTAGKLSIALKLEILNLNEMIVAIATADFAGETQIIGSAPVSTVKSINGSSAYKTGDKLLLINTGAGIQILTIALSDNIDRMVGEAAYLKAATDLEEITGTATDVATNPASNLAAFDDRIIGASSGAFLATDTTNGIMSAADKTKLDGFTDVVNRGWFSGVDPGAGAIGSTNAHSGDVSSAQLIDGGNGSSPGYNTYLVTMAHAMANSNYFVRLMTESQGTIGLDNDCLLPVFKIISTTTFQISIQETYATTQSLKIHIEAVQL